MTSANSPAEIAVFEASLLLAQVIAAANTAEAVALMRRVADLLIPIPIADREQVADYAVLRWVVLRIPGYFVDKTALCGGEDWRPS